MGYLIIRVGVSFVDWAFVNAIWSVPVSPQGIANTEACREAKGVGACWAVITEKHRFILFGTYPYDEHWRPLLVCGLFVGLYIVSAMRRFWRWELALIWAAVLTVIGILMWGGVFGLTYVPQERWGGLPITLILATFGLALVLTQHEVADLDGRLRTALTDQAFLPVAVAIPLADNPAAILARVAQPNFLSSSITG
jgi:general L-amino acid transport system permease protein